MRPTPRPPLTRHRLDRLNAWARLWLVWFAGVFALFCGAGEGERVLKRVARGVRGLIFANAAARVRLAPHPARHRYGFKHRVTLRRLDGSALRRALRGKDAATRFFAILSVMRDAEAHIDKLARRLRRGLTRLRILFPQRAAEALTHVCAGPPACAADTS